MSINVCFGHSCLDWNDRIKAGRRGRRGGLGMQNRLILTLWLVGAVLYAGSTVFLAHAVLGGGSSAPDKTKAATVAAASDAKCQKDSVASVGAKSAAEPQKTAAIEPKKPEAPKNPAKPSAPESATSDSAALNPAPNSEQRSAETDDPSEDQPAPDTSSPDTEPIPDGVQQQDALGPSAGEGQNEQDQWAHVVAGTADMRSEPSMQAPLIYALPSGWQVRVISRQPGWVQVQMAITGAGAGLNPRPSRKALARTALEGRMGVRNMAPIIVRLTLTIGMPTRAIHTASRHRHGAGPAISAISSAVRLAAGRNGDCSQ